MLKRTACAVAFVLAVTVPAYAQTGQVTQDDVAAAAERRKEVAAQVAQANADYEAAVIELVAVEDDLVRLGKALTAREVELAVAADDVRAVAQRIYMSAGVEQLGIFAADSIADYQLAVSYLGRAAADDQATIDRLQAVRAAYIEQQAVLEEAVAHQEEVAATAERVANQMLQVLSAADDEYKAVAATWARQEAERKAREEEERRRREATSTTTTSAAPTTTSSPGSNPTTTTTTLAPPPPVNGKTCPVNGAVTFTDTWGAPRSGGRTHQGVDMIAARGTPLVAIEAATVSQIGNGGLGGKTVWLRADTGDAYYYAHLDGWASGLSVGDHLDVGELLGYVGNTGNAAYTVPHLHFEYHPGGGAAVNPYPLAADLCL